MNGERAVRSARAERPSPQMTKSSAAQPRKAKGFIRV